MRNGERGDEERKKGEKMIEVSHCVVKHKETDYIEEWEVHGGWR